MLSLKSCTFKLISFQNGGDTDYYYYFFLKCLHFGPYKLCPVRKISIFTEEYALGVHSYWFACRRSHLGRNQFSRRVYILHHDFYFKILLEIFFKEWQLWGCLQYFEGMWIFREIYTLPLLTHLYSFGNIAPSKLNTTWQ